MELKQEGNNLIHRVQELHLIPDRAYASLERVRETEVDNSEISYPSNSQTNVKASSTTSEFTKRKNWSQHIIDEIQVSNFFRFL